MDIPGLMEKAHQEMKVERYEDAIRSFDRALSVDPDFLFAFLFALNNKGYALNALARYKEPIACFDRVLEITPNNIRAMTAKAIALCNLGRTKEADDCIRMADYQTG